MEFAVGGMCGLGLRDGMYCFGSPTAVCSRVMCCSLLLYGFLCCPCLHRRWCVTDA